MLSLYEIYKFTGNNVILERGLLTRKIGQKLTQYKVKSNKPLLPLNAHNHPTFWVEILEISRISNKVLFNTSIVKLKS